MGDGSFRTKPGFGIFLTVGSSTGEGLKWPSWMPIQIRELGIEWEDIQNHPDDFILTLSASVNEIKGLKGLEFSGTIEGVKISPKLLLQGKFPIIDIASIGVSVKGNLFGGEIDAALIGGILKLDKEYNIIGTFDSTTPVEERVFFMGVQGGFSMAGIGGLTIRFALSELGPLGVFINVEIPGGVVLEPNSGLAINDFSAGVEFFKSLPSIDDPFALRNPDFELPSEMTADQWLASVKQQVAMQAKMVSQNPNLGGFFAAFTAPMTITGGAKIYSIYTSQQTFNGEVMLKISTDGKLLAVGKLNFAADNISISAKHGKFKMGFRNASGEEVAFDVVELPEASPNELKPTTSLIDPVPDGVSIDINTINEPSRKFNGHRYVDAVYNAPSGAEIDFDSILDSDDEFTM
jgi:hypothetical protein